MSDQSNPKALTTFDIAKHCNVTHRTVRQWISDGKLKSYRTPGKHSRVSVEDFLTFLNQYDMPFPKDIYGLKQNRVLIVDDDQDTVKMIKKILGQNGDFETETAYDGFSAGTKFAEFKPNLITLDIRMPKMDGFAVLKQIREGYKNKHVKIIVISGVVEEQEKKAIERLGANAVFSKPFDHDVLMATISELMETVV